MLSNRSAVGSVLLVLALGLAGAACGGSDDAASPLAGAGAGDDSTSSGDTAAADTAAADTAGAASNAGSESSSSGDSEIPQLAQGAWEGTLHFEITGAVEAAEDLLGGAQTQGAFTLMTFAASDTGAGSQIAFTADSTDQAAVFVTSQDFTGGGDIGVGKPCSITMSKNDDDAAEGSFHCEHVTGVSTKSLADDLIVDIEGVFALARP